MDAITAPSISPPSTSTTKSTFLNPRPLTQPQDIASLHLSHTTSIPVKLQLHATRPEDAGYAEGVVTNTKFGSFPHSTLIGIPWGSQVRASVVDTGSRGREGLLGRQRKRKAREISIGCGGDGDGEGGEGGEGDDDQGESLSRSGVMFKEASAASTGFIHVLPPTPENWTTSLPHRTQVVYTPDYSYILQRIRARPGSVLIEAGSGSGSFTHAAVRAVFDGRHGRGRVCTFEFHAERHRKVREEMVEHGIGGVVTAVHRDVYKEGFMLPPSEDGGDGDGQRTSPRANAVFLDLPAPWEALPHLARGEDSPLDAENTVHICTFSPCIEQAQKTISTMRRLGWVEAEMVEMQHRKIDVRREYTGLKYDGMRSVNAVAANVDEALVKLREVEDRARKFTDGGGEENRKHGKKMVEQNKQIDASKTLFNQGKVVHRSESELKTHTSYLVFAILPRAWSEADEEKLRADVLNGSQSVAAMPKSQRQLKKEAKQRKRVNTG